MVILCPGERIAPTGFLYLQPGPTPGLIGNAQSVGVKSGTFRHLAAPTAPIPEVDAHRVVRMTWDDPHRRRNRAALVAQIHHILIL